ncbi:MAG: hypothetical protein J6J38_00005, partial [Lachnospiraceae bacterium]|nr:hypothetical protein [Lachnospiraceae bacterium]
MEGLNCKLSITSIGGSGTATGAIRTQVQAGTDDIQIGGLYQYYGTGIAAENLIFNLANTELFPYNDFERDYWGVQYIDDLSYKGSNFFVTGPMALRYTGGVYVTYINSNKWLEFYPEQNIYDIVRDGKWTLDKMYEYANGAYIDKNGDGNVDERVYDDRWQNPGDKTFFKSLYDESKTNVTSRFVQDERTLSCQNIHISYSIQNNEWLKKNLGV